MESQLERVITLCRVVLLLPVVMFLIFLFFVLSPAGSGV